MKQTLLCLALALSIFAPSTFASATKTVTFNGQNNESLTISYQDQETRYRDEVVNTTCTRQVPNGVEQVCEQVLRYREQCHYEPGRQDCHYTPSREQCHTTPSRQECRYEQGGVVCSYENGRRVCRNEPGHQVCRTIPGQRVCQTIPGDYVCTQIPGHNVCNQVPYYERVCHNETRYRTESYSCQRTVSVPYNVKIAHEALVDLTFDNAMNVATAELNVLFLADGEIKLATNKNDVLVLAQKENLYTERNGDKYTTHASYRISFLPKERVLSPVRNPADQIQLTQDQLSFVIGKSFNPSQLKVYVRLHAKKTLFHKEIDVQRTFNGNELRMIDISNGTISTQSTVQINMNEIGVELKKRKYDITIITSVELKGGEVINDEQLSLSQTKRINEYKVD